MYGAGAMSFLTFSTVSLSSSSGGQSQNCFISICIRYFPLILSFINVQLLKHSIFVGIQDVLFQFT